MDPIFLNDTTLRIFSNRLLEMQRLNYSVPDPFFVFEAKFDNERTIAAEAKITMLEAGLFINGSKVLSRVIPAEIENYQVRVYSREEVDMVKYQYSKEGYYFAGYKQLPPDYSWTHAEVYEVSFRKLAPIKKQLFKEMLQEFFMKFGTPNYYEEIRFLHDYKNARIYRLAAEELSEAAPELVI